MKERLLLLIFFFALSSSAQVTMQEITTDSINVFIQPQNIKSANLAMAASLILPGVGHHYLGRAKSALSYISFDILALFGAILCEQYSSKLKTESYGYAGLYASASENQASDKYWSAVGEFNSMESYNTAVRLNRQFEDEITDESRNWNWVDDIYKEEFNQIRKNSRRFHTAASFFMGAMVLNRVVAFVEIRASTRYKGIKTSLQFNPSISPDLSTAGIELTAKF